MAYLNRLHIIKKDPFAFKDYRKLLFGAADSGVFFTACAGPRQFLWVSDLRPYSPGGILNALATTPLLAASSIHRLRLRLLGYLILFAPLAFVSQCQFWPSKAPSPLVFFPISMNFTSKQGIPFAPTILKSRSSRMPVQGWALGFDIRLPKPPTDALHPIIPVNACTLCLTAAAGTELAGAYSSGTVIYSSLRKGVYNPRTFFLHAALLRQAFAHCGKFLTAASRRSLGRVSVPVWLIILSDQLLIVALVSSYLTN